MSVPELAAKAKELTAHEQFAQLHADAADRLATLAHEWAAGYWSASGFAAEMDATLLEAHTQAVVIGRQHAGDDAPREADDERFAAQVVETEHAYLQRFVDQMEAGEFTAEDGSRDGERVARRAASYSTRLVGSANEAMFLTLPPETLIYWHTTGSEASCDDCPEMEEASPWRADLIPFHVGQNQTACLVNCLCYEETEEGLRGFSIPG